MASHPEKSSLPHDPTTIPTDSQDHVTPEKSNSSLHTPPNGGSDLHDEELKHSASGSGATPAADGKPLEKAVSKEVLERSKFRTALIMFSLCMCVFLAALDMVSSSRDINMR
jgi:hypothetical protein